jgi:hypothetical protein
MCGLTADGDGSYDYDEIARLFRTGTVRTRKQHQCPVCDETIPLGSFAHTQSGVCDGSGYTTHVHLQCRDLAERVQGSSWEDVLYFVEEDHGESAAELHRASVRWAHGEPWRVTETAQEDE